MTQGNLLEAMNDIDFDMVEDAERHVFKSRKRWLPWTAAAVALLVVGVAFGLGKKQKPSSLINPPQNNPPLISYISSGQNLTGKQTLLFGEKAGMNAGTADIALPDFYVDTVLEVQVLEVLPDVYFDMSNNQVVHVAKLRVVDQVNTEGFPNEIWLQYAYYDAQVLKGYDSFVLSVHQLGVENYMLLNQTRSRVDYFSDMFSTPLGLGYGSVIAFRDGQVEENFWNTTRMTHPDYVCEVPGASYFLNPELAYPACADSTVGEVKENILKKDAQPAHGYMNAEKLFVGEDAEKWQEYLSPESGNIFFHHLKTGATPSLQYTRAVNGFPTDEVIVISAGVERKGASYSSQELERMPNIGQTLEQINLQELKPSHIEVQDNMVLRYAVASGAYRKVDGQIYGIVKVVWQYALDERNQYIMDDCYFLYDEQCNGRVVEREELRNIIGEDPLISSFVYDRYCVFY